MTRGITFALKDWAGIAVRPRDSRALDRTSACDAVPLDRRCSLDDLVAHFTLHEGDRQPVARARGAGERDLAGSLASGTPDFVAALLGTVGFGWALWQEVQHVWHTCRPSRRRDSPYALWYAGPRADALRSTTPTSLNVLPVLSASRSESLPLAEAVQRLPSRCGLLPALVGLSAIVG